MKVVNESCTQLSLKKSLKWAIKYFSQMKTFNFLGYIYWRVFISRSTRQEVESLKWDICYCEHKVILEDYETDRASSR